VIPGVSLIILGRQGAGKGTQCVRLSRHYVVPHISTGDMLRAAVKEGTELGRQAKAIMDLGNLLPDEIMIGLVQERLGRDDTRARGYILDGFPRTVPQAQALVESSVPKNYDLAIDLEVPRDLVLARLASRRVCVDCGANFTASQSPLHGQWVCRVCGGDVVHRDDDTEDAINRRLDLYDSDTAPLLDFYAERDELAVVDGVGTPDEVLDRLVEAIDGRRRRPPAV
jgi:adenylate kinase